MKNLLKNKRSLLTGGSRGIGAAIDKRLVAGPEAGCVTGGSLTINGGFNA